MRPQALSRPVVLVGVFMAALLIALVALAPLSLVWGGRGAALGLTAAEVRGTIWSGRLVQARLGAVPLGDVQLRANPLGLLLGQGWFSVRGGSLSARLVLGRGETRVLGLSGAASLVLLAPASGLDGRLEARGVNLTFGPEGCKAAQGPVVVGEITLQGQTSPGLQLEGEARCGEAGAVLLPLMGQTALGPIELQLQVSPQGAVTLEPDSKT